MLRLFTNINRHLSIRRTIASMEGVTLQHVTAELEKFAPLTAAEKWDNVGLLIEPHNMRPIKNIILTNDLTERVMQEAVSKQADMIISYHPPIFAPLKRITQSNWKERIVSRCLAASIALYSPHTAWDSAPNGVNDWLAAAIKPVSIKPIHPHAVLGEPYGAGRICETSNLTVRDAISALQHHIGHDVHVALGVHHQLDSAVHKVALCAGSGASVLKGVTDAQLYISGEMSHHELLDANHSNATVLLCNHSNSERGFLHVFRTRLQAILASKCAVHVSTEDADPLKTFVKH